MEHFNQVANSWDTPEKLKLSADYAEEISRHLKNDVLKVLEVGCGTGLLGSQFVKGNNKLTGVDTSKGMLEVFNEKFKNNSNVKSYLANLENENIPEHGFNLILSSMAFHHLIDPEKMLLKLKELSTSDGIIAIIDLDKEDGTFHPDPKNMGVHHFGFSKATIEQWGNSAGLTLLEWKIVHQIHKNEKVYPIFLAVFSR